MNRARAPRLCCYVLVMQRGEGGPWQWLVADHVGGVWVSGEAGLRCLDPHCPARGWQVVELPAVTVRLVGWVVMTGAVCTVSVAVEEVTEPMLFAIRTV